MQGGKAYKMEKLVGYILIVVLIGGLILLVYVTLTNEPDRRYDNIEKLRKGATPPAPG